MKVLVLSLRLRGCEFGCEGLIRVSYLLSSLGTSSSPSFKNTPPFLLLLNMPNIL